ncbi:hypothetical protein [Lysinibacillus sp. NPDC093692]|uniref:hypothetical protein n=1 Tax=Lysinibacillus sp. NPDC093692 TaxID=3390578 RepID=UPI003D0876BB
MIIFILSGVLASFFIVLGCIKPVRKKGYLVLFIGLAINAFIAPISLVFGIMATDNPSSGLLDFILGFLFIQSIPLLILFICIVVTFIMKGVNQTIYK